MQPADDRGNGGARQVDLEHQVAVGRGWYAARREPLRAVSVQRPIRFHLPQQEKTVAQAGQRVDQTDPFQVA